MTQKKNENHVCAWQSIEIYAIFSPLHFFHDWTFRELCCVWADVKFSSKQQKKAQRCHLNWLLFHVRCYTLSLVSRVWWIRTIFCSSSSLVDCIAIDFSLSREYMLLLRYVRRAHNPRLSRAFMPSIASNMSLSINNDLINLLIESSIEASKTQ